MNIKNFIMDRAFTFMILGIVMAVSGVISSWTFHNENPRYVDSILPELSWGLAITGFVVYFIGRVALAIKRKHGYKRPRSDDDDDADDTKNIAGGIVNNSNDVNNINNVQNKSEGTV